ncbi:hypothetical protein DW954_07420 [Clostridium sp. AM45-5]|nr:hypothetical protein DW954_07420 [Clostridium sp. AM45-5]
MCLVDPKKRYRQQEKIRLPFFSSFIYANNEPKSALAQDFGDCHDNKGETREACFRLLSLENL